MDIQLIIDHGDIDIIPDTAKEPLFNNLILSSVIPLGGWWQSTDFGSRLHTFARSKLTQATIDSFYIALKDATKWLLDTGRASAIDITVEQADNRINYTITATCGSKSVVFNHFYDLTGRAK